MNDYFIRVLPADYDRLLTLGQSLGAIDVNTDPNTGAEYITATQGGCWDYIGEIHRPTGDTTATEFGPVPVMAPITDAAGTAYLHINLRTPLSLGEIAAQMAIDNPEIAAGMADLGRFFLLDAVGDARAPANPQRVFA